MDKKKEPKIKDDFIRQCAEGEDPLPETNSVEDIENRLETQLIIEEIFTYMEVDKDAKPDPGEGL